MAKQDVCKRPRLLEHHRIWMSAKHVCGSRRAHAHGVDEEAAGHVPVLEWSLSCE